MEPKPEGENGISLPENLPPEIQWAYYLGIANAYREALKYSDSRLRQELENKLAWAESHIKSEVKIRIERSGLDRFRWDSIASGVIALDDDMRVIGDRKVATYWKLKYGKKQIILPPSAPVFVGWVGDGSPILEFGDRDYIGKIRKWIKERVVERPDCFLPELEELIKLHPLYSIGKLYFTQLPNGTWELRWNRRKRALPLAEDWFLLELAAKLEQVANLAIAATDLWEWMDAIEDSFKCKGVFENTKISLNYYHENNTWAWRLCHRRGVHRVRRYWVGAISKAIQSCDEDRIRQFIDRQDILNNRTG